MIETYNEVTTRTTTFWILAETLKHIICILQHQQPVPRLKIENLMAQYTHQTTQTIMETTLTTTFWIIAKYSSIWSAMYNVNNKFIGLRQKLWFHCAQMKQLKQPFFRLTARIFWHEDNPCNQFFIITSTDSCTFRKKDTCNAFCSE